jgi:outer membrane receptor for ferric coprogen and ferric-rhodotorulic acid
MIRNLALATAGLAMIAGFAAAQDVQTTTDTHAQSSTTPVTKSKEAYEWSVDTTTTKVPVHPTVVEKSTTVVTTPVAPPPPVVQEHSSTTTTTTNGDQ